MSNLANRAHTGAVDTGATSNLQRLGVRVRRVDRWPGPTGDRAVKINAAVEVAGVIRFVGSILCRDCSDRILAENGWITDLIGEDL